MYYSRIVITSLLSCFLITTLNACVSSKVNRKKKQDTSLQTDLEKFSYHFETKTCSTGSIQAHDEAQYCEALQDEVLNENCAKEERIKKFITDCPSYTWDAHRVFIQIKAYEGNYEIELESCKTGRKELKTHTKLCEALLDEKENNDCAKDLRQKVFETY